jgi:hypothetical protein
MNIHVNASSCLRLFEGTLKENKFFFDLKKDALIYLIKAFRDADETYIPSLIFDYKILKPLNMICSLQYQCVFPLLIEYLSLVIKVKSSNIQYELINSDLITILLKLRPMVANQEKEKFLNLFNQILIIVESVYKHNTTLVRNWIFIKGIGSLVSTFATTDKLLINDTKSIIAKYVTKKELLDMFMLVKLNNRKN